MNSPDPVIQKELLDDFYAECGELLTSSRVALTEVESKLANPEAARPHLEALFRNLHSIKGNSGIVGLKSAEEVAHAMEDLLRGLAKGTLPVTAPLVDLLLGNLQRLEEIITAHRLGKPGPETREAVAELRRQLKTAPQARESKPGTPGALPPPAAPAAGAEPAASVTGEQWICSFTPSPELDKRGINLASVRSRLGVAGEILKATPVVKDKVVRFDFIVAFKAGAPDLTAWAADGVTVAHHASGPKETAPASAPSLRPDAGAQPATGGEAFSVTPSHMIRVDVSRLDEVMRILSEIVVQKSRLEARIGKMAGDTSGLREVDLLLGRSLRDLREAISRVRLVPVAEIFARMPFVVRELARESDKKVKVALEGHQTDIDKFLVERLKEPLLHLVRNAFAHGIETPAERFAAGKPAEATITLSATSSSDSITIQIRDDGRGVNAAAIAARAKALGLPLPETLDDDGLLKVLCLPGFSTRTEADMAAGRGVGMSVVATTVRELGGRLTMTSESGRGTQFSLRLPLSLSIVEVLVTVVGDQLCAIPQSAVAEIIQVEAATLRTIQRAELISYRNGLLPVSWLRSLFGFEFTRTGLLTVIVLRSEKGLTGLIVDGVRTHREVVVRPLLDPLLHVPGIAGATDLGDGRPILILDPVALTTGPARAAGEKLSESTLRPERRAS